MGRIQTARHDGLLRRLFSIKGGESLLPETLGDLFPTLDIESVPIELMRLSGWQMGLVGQTTTSAVGETLGLQLFNPAGSGKVVIPTAIYISGGTSSTFFVGVTSVPLATAVVGRQRDTREGVTARTVATSRMGVDTVPPVGAGQIRFVANAASLEIIDRAGLAVLAPGTGFTLVSISTNVTYRSMWFYRERTAEPSELSF